MTLNFVNAEIDAVARAIGIMTGRNMVIDPRVKGNVSITTERPVSPQMAYNQFLATVRLQGFTVVESGGLYKVVPEADAKLQGGAVSVGAVSGSGSQLQTQIFLLNFENANNLVPVLRPLISPNNTINVNPGNNSLVITDYADNLQRIARIVAALDVSNATDLEIIPLRHAVASDLAPLVTRLVDGSSGTGAPAAAGAGQSDTSFRTTLIAEPRSNSLILRAANPARVALIKSLVNKLDQPASGANNGQGNIYVVHLKNADATKLAVTLRAALSAEARPVTSTASTVLTTPVATGAVPTSGTSGSGGTSAQPSTGGQIQADPATNTLIITAPEPQYRQLRAVIDQLDARRAQVFVESLIAEVSADKAAEFGVQWQGPLGSKGDGLVGLLGTNFSVGGANIISLAAGAAKGTTLPSTGGNFALAQRTNGIYVLGFLARFLESSGDGNVLSTPNLLTLDNEEAKIVVGENRPFVTGQFTNTGTTGSTVNPFQTIERKDVGLTLRVKPQISENGTIKLQVFQEVS
ncbi:MAG: type secretion system protein GspD, partial [Pseudomonadota bacterium]